MSGEYRILLRDKPRLSEITHLHRYCPGARAKFELRIPYRVNTQVDEYGNYTYFYYGRCKAAFEQSYIKIFRKFFTEVFKGECYAR